MTKIDLNVAPYYDNYNENDKYQKILFKADKPIQGKELIQVQDILQNQIEPVVH